MSKIRFLAVTQPDTPPANRVYLWYDEDAQIFKIMRDDGIAEPLAGTAPPSTEALTLLCVVRNQTGVTIPAKSVVYISGASGNRPLISLAQASSEMSSSKTFAITKEAILHNGTGYVVTSGELINVPTNMYTEGNLLWLSSSTPGGLTTTKPSAPNHAVFCGYVVRSHPTEGIIEVKIQNGYELEELHNVAINGVTNGDILQYESATSLWKNVPSSSVAGKTFKVEYFTLDANQILLGEVGLAHTPTDPTSVMLDVISGGPQVYGEDFEVVNYTLSWSGKPIAASLAVGDKIRVTYTYT
jgi:hypothetical protein